MNTNIIKVLLISLSFGLMTSCSKFLDVSDELAGGITDISQVFDNVDRTRKWYGQIYNNVPDYSAIWVETAAMGNAWAGYADELYHRLARNSGKYDNWNSSNTRNHRWGTLYESIRQANIFLERVKPIAATGINANVLTETEVERYKANIRFMRALYYYYLMEQYGPVPIITVSKTLQDEIDIPRNSLDEVINFIDTELQEAMQGMEQEPYHTQLDYAAVPTKGAALAVRAKLWVYAASPLFNGGFAEALSITNSDGKHLFPEHDNGKLQKAVTALREFLDYAEQGRYELFRNAGTFNPGLSVYGMFQDYNREIIWATSKDAWGTATNGAFDQFVTPRNEPSGLGGIHVVQELVDDFYMADGLPIKSTGFLSASPAYSETGFGTLDGVEVSRMYIGREPRFYNTITFSGKKWHISNAETQFYLGGNADKNVVDGAPVTGYLLYKRMNRTVYGRTATGAVSRRYRPSIIFRLAEFHLLYAEMLNEVQPGNSDILRYTNMVRERAGLPKLEDLNPAIAGNQDLQREAIRRESRIELATEGQRYFDVRRWMIAEKPVGEGGQGGEFTGMNPDGNKAAFHERRRFQTRYFGRKNYLYPIPLTEMQRTKGMLVQNPGWDS
ncbi:MAG TPA: RagB/SusD family nutrient uptake outer membrane protein [Niabella sp.]|nr:RagB/SusD family nutrient uptake outer membrane protein [Niabella sp.]